MLKGVSDLTVVNGSAPFQGTGVAQMGHSFLANGQQTSSNQEIITNQSIWGWVNIFSGHAFYVPLAWNFGVVGATIAQIYTQLPSVLATGASIVHFIAGTNDIITATAPATVVQQMLYGAGNNNQGIFGILQALLGAGKTVFYEHIAPRGSAAGGFLTANNYQIMLRYNQIMRGIAQKDPAYLALANLPNTGQLIMYDPTPAVVDNTDISHTAFFNAITIEGTHYNCLGTYNVAKILWNIINKIYAPRTICTTGSDKFDAVNNPGGNLLINGGNNQGQLMGTGGAITASTGFTGTGSVANSFQVLRNSGTSTATFVGAKENPRQDGPANGERQICSFAASSVGGSAETYSFTLNFSIAIGNISVGDLVYAECGIEHMSNSNMTALQLDLQEAGPSTPNIARDCSYNGLTSYNMPNENWGGVMRTPPFAVQTGTTALQVFVQPILNTTSGSASAVFKVADFAVRKVALT